MKLSSQVAALITISAAMAGGYCSPTVFRGTAQHRHSGFFDNQRQYRKRQRHIPFKYKSKKHRKFN